MPSAPGARASFPSRESLARTVSARAAARMGFLNSDGTFGVSLMIEYTFAL